MQSIGFERGSLRATAGVIDAGEVHFDTGSAERMTIVSDEVWVRLPGRGEQSYCAGTAFEVRASSGFDLRAAAPVAYLCEFLR